MKLEELQQKLSTDIQLLFIRLGTGTGYGSRMSGWQKAGTRSNMVAFLSTELRNFLVKENDNNQTQLTVLESVKQHFLPKIFCLFHKSRRISSLRPHRIQYQDFRLADTVSGKHSLIE